MFFALSKQMRGKRYATEIALQWKIKFVTSFCLVLLCIKRIGFFFFDKDAVVSAYKKKEKFLPNLFIETKLSCLSQKKFSRKKKNTKKYKKIEKTISSWEIKIPRMKKCLEKLYPQIAAWKKTKVRKFWSFMQMRANFWRRDRTKISRVKDSCFAKCLGWWIICFFLYFRLWIRMHSRFGVPIINLYTW